MYTHVPTDFLCLLAYRMLRSHFSGTWQLSQVSPPLQTVNYFCAALQTRERGNLLRAVRLTSAFILHYMHYLPCCCPSPHLIIGCKNLTEQQKAQILAPEKSKHVSDENLSVNREGQVCHFQPAWQSQEHALKSSSICIRAS